MHTKPEELSSGFSRRVVLAHLSTNLSTLCLLGAQSPVGQPRALEGSLMCEAVEPSIQIQGATSAQPGIESQLCHLQSV